MMDGVGTAALLAMLVAATAGGTPVVGATEIPGGQPAQQEAG